MGAPYVGLALLLLLSHQALSAPVADEEATEITDLESYPAEGCYYNFEHYEEGDRIVTNEPCLNCTCHNHMLMCYLRVCPFTKAIGQDCTVEKRPDQCCPVITCPEVPVQLLTSSTTQKPTTLSTAIGLPDNFGCTLSDNTFYPDGAQIPSDPRKPCELCYCIRNRTACIMQECTLQVEGCQPVYQKGVCCPVRYDCDYDSVTTPGTTSGLVTTPGGPAQCLHDGVVYNDGEMVEFRGKSPCEHCYCMRGDVVCAVQECGAPLQGPDCVPLPPPPGHCCPDTFQCANGTVPLETLLGKPETQDDSHSSEVHSQESGHPVSSNDSAAEGSESSEEQKKPQVEESSSSNAPSQEMQNIGEVHEGSHSPQTDDGKPTETPITESSVENDHIDHGADNSLGDQSDKHHEENQGNKPQDLQNQDENPNTIYGEHESNPSELKPENLENEHIESVAEQTVSGDKNHQEPEKPETDVPEKFNDSFNNEDSEEEEDISDDHHENKEPNNEGEPQDHSDVNNKYSESNFLTTESAENADKHEHIANDIDVHFGESHDETQPNALPNSPENILPHSDEESHQSDSDETMVTGDEAEEHQTTIYDGEHKGQQDGSNSEQVDQTSHDDLGHSTEISDIHLGGTSESSADIKPVVHTPETDSEQSSSAEMNTEKNKIQGVTPESYTEVSVETVEVHTSTPEINQPYTSPTSQPIEHGAIQEDSHSEINKTPYDQSDSTTTSSSSSEGQDITTMLDSSNVPRLPGEGSCVIEGHSYPHNSEVHTSNACQISCKCLNSIVHCKLVECPPAPTEYANCMPLQEPDSCCPSYTCDDKPSLPLESHNQVSTEYPEGAQQEETSQQVSSEVDEPHQDQANFNAETSEAVETEKPSLIEETEDSHNTVSDSHNLGELEANYDNKLPSGNVESGDKETLPVSHEPVDISSSQEASPAQENVPEEEAHSTDIDQSLLNENQETQTSEHPKPIDSTNLEQENESSTSEVKPESVGDEGSIGIVSVDHDDYKPILQDDNDKHHDLEHNAVNHIPESTSTSLIEESDDKTSSQMPAESFNEVPTETHTQDENTNLESQTQEQSDSGAGHVVDQSVEVNGQEHPHDNSIGNVITQDHSFEDVSGEAQESDSEQPQNELNNVNDKEDHHDDSNNVSEVEHPLHFNEENEKEHLNDGISDITQTEHFNESEVEQTTQEGNENEPVKHENEGDKPYAHVDGGNEKENPHEGILEHSNDEEGKPDQPHEDNQGEHVTESEHSHMGELEQSHDQMGDVTESEGPHDVVSGGSEQEHPHDQESGVNEQGHSQEDETEHAHDQVSEEEHPHDQVSEEEHPHDQESGVNEQVHPQEGETEHAHDQVSEEEHPHDQVTEEEHPHDQESGVNEQGHPQEGVTEHAHDQVSEEEHSHDQANEEEQPHDQVSEEEHPHDQLIEEEHHHNQISEEELEHHHEEESEHPHEEELEHHHDHISDVSEEEHSHEGEQEHPLDQANDVSEQEHHEGELEHPHDQISETEHPLDQGSDISESENPSEETSEENKPEQPHDDVGNASASESSQDHGISEQENHEDTVINQISEDEVIHQSHPDLASDTDHVTETTDGSVSGDSQKGTDIVQQGSADPQQSGESNETENVEDDGSNVTDNHESNIPITSEPSLSEKEQEILGNNEGPTQTEFHQDHPLNEIDEESNEVTHDHTNETPESNEHIFENSTPEEHGSSDSSDNIINDSHGIDHHDLARPHDSEEQEDKGQLEETNLNEDNLANQKHPNENEESSSGGINSEANASFENNETHDEHPQTGIEASDNTNKKENTEHEDHINEASPESTHEEETNLSPTVSGIGASQEQPNETGTENAEPEPSNTLGIADNKLPHDNTISLDDGIGGIVHKETPNEIEPIFMGEIHPSHTSEDESTTGQHDSNKEPDEEHPSVDSEINQHDSTPGQNDKENNLEQGTETINHEEPLPAVEESHQTPDTSEDQQEQVNTPDKSSSPHEAITNEIGSEAHGLPPAEDSHEENNQQSSETSDIISHDGPSPQESQESGDEATVESDHNAIPHDSLVEQEVNKESDISHQPEPVNKGTEEHSDSATNQDVHGDGALIPPQTGLEETQSLDNNVQDETAENTLSSGELSHEHPTPTEGLSSPDEASEENNSEQYNPETPTKVHEQESGTQAIDEKPDDSLNEKFGAEVQPSEVSNSQDSDASKPTVDSSENQYTHEAEGNQEVNVPISTDNLQNEGDEEVSHYDHDTKPELTIANQHIDETEIVSDKPSGDNSPGLDIHVADHSTPLDGNNQGVHEVVLEDSTHDILPSYDQTQANDNLNVQVGPESSEVSEENKEGTPVQESNPPETGHQDQESLLENKPSHEQETNYESNVNKDPSTSHQSQDEITHPIEGNPDDSSPPEVYQNEGIQQNEEGNQDVVSSEGFPTQEADHSEHPQGSEEAFPSDGHGGSTTGLTDSDAVVNAVYAVIHQQEGSTDLGSENMPSIQGVDIPTSVVSGHDSPVTGQGETLGEGSIHEGTHGDQDKENLVPIQHSPADSAQDFPDEIISEYPDHHSDGGNEHPVINEDSSETSHHHPTQTEETVDISPELQTEQNTADHIPGSLPDKPGDHAQTNYEGEEGSEKPGYVDVSETPAQHHYTPESEHHESSSSQAEISTENSPTTVMHEVLGSTNIITPDQHIVQENEHYQPEAPLFQNWSQKPSDQLATTKQPPTIPLIPEDSQYPVDPEADYEEEDSNYSPGTCRYGGKIYLSAQQIPRDDPCDFCFCFRSDIICLQQSCPPPIQHCYQETIPGFCCPRYECHVSMATMVNVTTTTTTTTTTLPPHFLAHAYKGAAKKTGCQVKGVAYRVGERIASTSGPCLDCRCGADGQMKCEPTVCNPQETLLRQVMDAAVMTRRRRHIMTTPYFTARRLR